MRRAFLFLVVLVALAATAGAALASAGRLSSPELQAVRAAVARFHDYDQAKAAGYSADGEPCISSPAGAMGVHAPNQGLIRSGVLDPLKPQILLYEPKANGGKELVGVEYFQAALANTPDGPVPWFSPDAPPNGFVNRAPSLLGHRFDGPMAGHNPSMPWHYDLHVWVVQENATGTFEQFNPAVTCP